VEAALSELVVITHSSSAVTMTVTATSNKKENTTPANSINLLDEFFRHGPAVEKAEKDDHQDSVRLLHLNIVGAHVLFNQEGLAATNIQIGLSCCRIGRGSWPSSFRSLI